MPRSITQYRVFIGSPGGLKDERLKFRAALEKCSAHYGIHKDVQFHPVCWEDRIGGGGRPQEQINEDLKTCDYAVFVLHDRWGSPTGNGHTSGTQEEWALAEELYKAGKIRNIALFFKAVDPGKLADPGDQLKQVLAFKKTIEDEKRYLFKQYAALDEFVDTVDGHLAGWLRDHDRPVSGLSVTDPTATTPAAGKSTIAAPGFDYWIAEAIKGVDGDNADHISALVFASKAIDAARSDIEWAKAKNTWGAAQSGLGKQDEAMSAFTAIEKRFLLSLDGDRRYWRAMALFNKGVALGALGRNDDAIAVYDDLLARFGTATELPLREQVAMALVNKGAALGALSRHDDAIAVYDDLIARFGSATELPLREPVASALYNKGVALGLLGRNADEIAVYDDLLARFGSATELPVREQIAKALYNKGVRLGALGRNADEIAVYDDLLARFGSATELPVREQIAKALYNRGVRLGALGRNADEIAVYDDLLRWLGPLTARTRFSRKISFAQRDGSRRRVFTRPRSATELPLREQVAMALVNKGGALGALSRYDDAIAVFDDLLARFGSATELRLREQVAKALFNKAFALGALGRNDNAIAVYDDLFARFGSATELPLREPSAMALVNKGVALGALSRHDDAIAVFDDLLARFGSATELRLREPVAIALYNKGVALHALGRANDAILVCDDILARFGAATESALLEQVDKARRLRSVLTKPR